MIVMTTYQNRNQIETDLRKMLPHQIDECKECDELPVTLERLIKHNFQAAFVCYNKKKGLIEVGVEEYEAVDAYPEITVHEFRLEEIISQLGKTFRNEDHDLKFYGKLLAGHGSVNEIDEVVLV
jgi:hypothetical protein